jgi:hypothetical protein
MLPMTVLRRLDCVLESTKGKVLEEHKRLKGQNATIADKMLRRVAKQQFCNTSKYDFAKLLADPEVRGSTRARINLSVASLILMPRPPLTGQDAISEFVRCRSRTEGSKEVGRIMLEFRL